MFGIRTYRDKWGLTDCVEIDDIEERHLHWYRHLRRISTSLWPETFPQGKASIKTCAAEKRETSHRRNRFKVRNQTLRKIHLHNDNKITIIVPILINRYLFILQKKKPFLNNT